MREQRRKEKKDLLIQLKFEREEVEDKEDESSALHLTSNSGDSFHASRQKTKLHALFRSNSADQCFELKARAPPLI